MAYPGYPLRNCLLNTNMLMETISVALVDDHSVVRLGVKSLVTQKGNVKVVLEASNGKELFEKLHTFPIPDIIILDVNMPSMNGVDTLKRLKVYYPEIKAIVYSLIKEEDTVINMISHGAKAYVSKSESPETLVCAIEHVYENGGYFGTNFTWKEIKTHVNGLIKDGFNGKQFLSNKEVKFIQLSATNLTYTEIAETIGVTRKTLENYRDSLYYKLNIKNRAALVLYGLRNGIIEI